ncbi:MAG: aminoacetone oxidase family FAD-binding enzyme [Phycisphaerales bacterium]
MPLPADQAEQAERTEVAVVGAGAAGLFAAIHAARAGARVVALDGAARLGAKILVAGGGRCNVTHRAVTERDYAGGTPGAIRSVLARFGVAETVDFFRALGVELKEEPTGKLFPVTDDARTVLDALLRAAREAGAALRHPARVGAVTADPRGGFLVHAADAPGPLRADRVILAAGGCALPKSGSDGSGHRLAASLGHSLTPLVVPALVPLRLPEGHWIRSLAGVATEVELSVPAPPGGTRRRIRGRLLCTHFGISGPAALDASRHLLHAAAAGAAMEVRIHWLPGLDEAGADEWLLQARGISLRSRLRERLPERLGDALLAAAGVDPAVTAQQAPRAVRRRLAELLGGGSVPVAGDRGFTFAEATAGGVPLQEIQLKTMESRIRPGLHLCGEVLDVDGRLGGFNFQWAWASGFVAGTAAASR